MLQRLKVSFSKTAVLKVELPDNVPAVLGNAALIQQVVMNLITDASEAIGDKEGAMRVSVARVQSSRSDEVRLEVNDTGCGMTEDPSPDLRSVFHDQIRRPRLGARRRARNHPEPRRCNQRDQRAARVPDLRSCCRSPAKCAACGGRAPAAAEEVRIFGGTVIIIEDQESLRVAVSKMLEEKLST